MQGRCREACCTRHADGAFSIASRDFGAFLGWASSAFYLGSRVSQIWKNWRRRSAEGLSLAMFGCAIAANVTYGAGILCRTYSLPALLASAPWILGSLGTVSLDVIIFLQVFIFSSPPIRCVAGVL